MTLGTSESRRSQLIAAQWHRSSFPSEAFAAGLIMKPPPIDGPTVITDRVVPERMRRPSLPPTSISTSGARKVTIAFSSAARYWSSPLSR